MAPVASAGPRTNRRRAKRERADNRWLADMLSSPNPPMPKDARNMTRSRGAVNRNPSKKRCSGDGRDPTRKIGHLRSEAAVELTYQSCQLRPAGPAPPLRSGPGGTPASWPQTAPASGCRASLPADPALRRDRLGGRIHECEPVGVFHITINGAGDQWDTSTLQGTFQFLANDVGPLYAGHFVEWFGDAINNKNAVSNGVINFVGTSATGSRINLHVEFHFRLSVSGQLTISRVTHC